MFLLSCDVTQEHSKHGSDTKIVQVTVYILGGFYQVDLNWADPGVLWKKAPRAMRAMRGKTLETVPFQPYFGCTKSFLKVLSH